MSQYAVWKRSMKELSLTHGREFENSVLPYLRLLWPFLHKPPEQSSLDRAGIDLADLSDHDTLVVGVQCKSWRFDEPTRKDVCAQRDKTLRSIAKFRSSPVTCDEYYVVHNRNKHYPVFCEPVREALGDLVRSRRTIKAELWSLADLFAKLEVAIRSRLELDLLHYAREQLHVHQEMFRTGHCHVSHVPVGVDHLWFERYKPCRRDSLGIETSCDVAEFAADPQDVRWTLITGSAGSGKTTSVLTLAARKAERVAIYVNCARLPEETTGGTSILLRDTLKQMAGTDSGSETDDDLFHSLAAPLFGSLLRRAGNGYLFIMDALDENRRFSELAGLQRLSNQLAEFECPVILTTRSEQLEAMLGNYSLAFSEFSAKYGPKRPARLLILRRWAKPQVQALLKAVLAKEEDRNAHKRMTELYEIVEDDSHEKLYGDLLFHPLFLNFVIDDVAEEGVRAANRSALIRAWVRRKVFRDFEKSARPVVDANRDVCELVHDMLQVMERVSWLMTSNREQGMELKESITAREVEACAEEEIGLRVNILPVLLHSVLTAFRTGNGENLRVGFLLKIFQEYFLAAYLVRTEQDPVCYPGAVRSLCEEIREASSLGPVC